jgi:hypothetical protein
MGRERRTRKKKKNADKEGRKAGERRRKRKRVRWKKKEVRRVLAPLPLASSPTARAPTVSPLLLPTPFSLSLFVVPLMRRPAAYALFF